ncbi:beta-glucosidase-like glycosyl hydrolase [Flammeovirgaceae bacterium 311]|nr:beta-glucosidase-like glycosyl hydrolase [Flammeovirgaceae bacterium 311]
MKILKYSTALCFAAQLFMAGGIDAQTAKNTAPEAQSLKETPQLNENNLKKVIKALTIEEKSLMVTGAKRREVVPVATPGRKQKNITAVGSYTYPFVHLGIPAIYLSDGPAGLRIAPRRENDPNTYYATAFPVATLVASSWDTKVAERVGRAMGHEALEYGVDILLGPALNIHRDPLGGRSFEYYSEDPLVSGKMTAAAVRGIQSQGVGTSIKHFAANNQETSRRFIDVIVSERALREIYLEGFKIAVEESDPWTVMSSYNKINGVYTSESPELLETILRKEWGFKGFVLSDWYGGEDPIKQVKAGNDLLMPGLTAWSEKIDSASRNGSLEQQYLDQNIERILNIAVKTPTFKNYPYSDKPNLKENAQVARDAAAQSMVLLKNEKKTLPFMQGTNKVAVFGNYSYKIIVGGTGSGMVNNEYSVSVAEGLEKAGYQLDQQLRTSYLQYLKKGRPQNLKADSLITALPKLDSILGELPIDESIIQQQAQEAEVAIVSIMRVFGEGGDRKLDNDYYLTAEEKKLLKKVSDAFHAKSKKVIVVLNIGGVIEVASWRDQADAILLAWQPGQEGGNALADIMSGKVNPSGKLATTFPMDYKDVPTAKNFPGSPSDKPVKVVHEEGIYVGYRYYDTFEVKPAYEFGFGLSYTDFTYGNLKLSSSKFKDKLTVSMEVKNTGTVAGREVVQFYLSAPAQTMHKPEKELKGFAKTDLLQPGQSQTLFFTLDARSLASFNADQSAWVAEPGSYTIKMGASSENIKKTASFELPKSIVAEKVNKVLVPQAVVEEFKLK